MTHTGQHQVVVAGMGPVGMTAALALAQRGLNVLVLEAGSELAAESRASTFHPPTLEMLDRLGVGAELIETGLVAPQFQYRDRDDGLLCELDLGLLDGETRFPYRLQNEQNNLTRIALRALEALPNVELRFDAPVARVETAEDHVKVYIGDDAGLDATPLHTEWLIAADGANSAVRRSLGIAFDGITYPVRYLVISTALDLTEVIPGLAPVSYVSDPQEWFVLLRTPRHWRALFPVPEDETDEQACDPVAVQRRMQSVHARDESYPIVHTTLYRVHQRVAASFRAGRVLLAGDAAHINNPLGGMGMNSGIHDAVAAAEVVAQALAGADPDACADAYTGVRRSMALEYVQAETHRNYQQLQERDAGVRARRREDLRALADDPQRMRELLRGSSMIGSVAESDRRLRRALAGAAGPRVRPTTPGVQLRHLLADGETLTVPGCFDGVTARLVEQLGFACAYLSGAATSAIALGQPDLGYAGLADMAGHAGRLTATMSLPLIADADTGYGDPLHVANTVRAFERAGVAGIHLEDQVAPKRCGHLHGKQVIAAAAMEQKLRAAVDAAQDIVVIARTDAYAIEGLDGVLARATAYAGCGVDALFVEGVHDPAELAAVADAAGGLPLLLNASEAGGPVVLPGRSELAACGVRLVIHPVSALLAAAGAAHEIYAGLRDSAPPNGTAGLTWDQLNELLGLPQALEHERRFATNQPEGNPS